MNNEDFTKNVIEAITANLDAINSLRADKENMSLADSAILFLMNKFGYTQIQASEVYDELKEGLNDYTARQQAMSSDESAIYSDIEAATDGYSSEERRNIYINVLTSLQIATDPDANLDDLMEKNAALSDEELVNEIVAALDGLPFGFVMNQVKDGITPESIALFGDAKDMHTEQFKLSAAVMLYASIKEGSINLPDANVELSPKIIGAMAGAGADAMAVTADLHGGKIELPLWRTVLNGIIRALFCVVFAALSTYAIIFMNAIIATVIFTIFGFGLTAVLLTLPAVYYATKHAIKIAEDDYAKLVDLLNPTFASIVAKLSKWANVVINKVKEWAQIAREKIAQAAAKKDAAMPENEIKNTEDNAPVLA